MYLTTVAPQHPYRPHLSDHFPDHHSGQNCPATPFRPHLSNLQYLPIQAPPCALIGPGGFRQGLGGGSTTATPRSGPRSRIWTNRMAVGGGEGLDHPVDFLSTRAFLKTDPTRPPTFPREVVTPPSPGKLSPPPGSCQGGGGKLSGGPARPNLSPPKLSGGPVRSKFSFAFPCKSPSRKLSGGRGSCQGLVRPKLAGDNFPKERGGRGFHPSN